MNIAAVSCNFPNCHCPGPKLHIGARAIGKRLGMTERQIFRTKGLPIQRRGSRLILRECVAKRFIEGA